MAGLFGKMFDLNRDGEVDSFERAMEWHFVDEMMREEQEEDSSDYEDDYEDDELTELELAGLDPEELEFMDEDERREALEEAGWIRMSLIFRGKVMAEYGRGKDFVQV